MTGDRSFFRRRAIERRRDPSQDARSAEAAATLQAKVAQQLAQSPLIQRLSAEARAAASNSGNG